LAPGRRVWQRSTLARKDSTNHSESYSRWAGGFFFLIENFSIHRHQRRRSHHLAQLRLIASAPLHPAQALSVTLHGPKNIAPACTSKDAARLHSKAVLIATGAEYR
jgi:hypothetical protein